MRMDLIDGIRGHLLIMMMLAHLSWQPGMDFLGAVHHARIIGLFDAEFLIVVSGLLVGLLYVRKFKTPDTLARFLFDRLFKIYRYYLMSAIPFLILIYLAADAAPVDAMLRATFEVLTVQNGGDYSDILPIYLYCFVLLLAASVTLLRFSAFSLLIPSALFYAASLPDFSFGVFGLSGRFMAFDVAAWQFLFCLAFVAGTLHRPIMGWVARLGDTPFLLLIALTATLTFAQRYWITYPVPFALPAEVPDNWARMQLHPIYLLRIVLVSVFVALLMLRAHPWLAWARRATHWYFSRGILRHCGVYSIQMFVFHVYLMAFFRYFDQDWTLPQRTVCAVILMAAFLAAPYGLRAWHAPRVNVGLDRKSATLKKR